MKYSVITFGCRVNQADSLACERELVRSGASRSDPETADVVIVNTCSVTASADQGARQTIRRIARANPNVQIVVTGCYATRSPAQVATLPNVIRVVPNDDKDALPTALRFGDGDGSCGAQIEPGVAGRTAFTLRVQTGCAERCSYCIIPTTRGRPRSVPLHEVVRQVEFIAAAGFKEMAITGVHLGSYGRDLTPGVSLLDLLLTLNDVRLPPSQEGLADLPSSPRLLYRISSLEPMDCSHDIVDLVASSARFAPHFHLPLQHASNRMLAAMRRPYTVEYYASLVDEIRTRIPSASIGSDVIVGFPGETDEDFEELSSYLERSPLTHVHVFPYSDRPGTEATAMEGKVPGAVIRDRSHRIRSIASILSARFREAQIGTVHHGLTIDDGSTVVTDNYLKVKVQEGRSRNERVRVRIASHHHGELLAG